MEAQIESLYRDKRKDLKKVFANFLTTEDGIGEYRTHVQHLEDQYELNLKVIMRYSFVVSAHIIFETRLIAFCDEVWKEKSLEFQIKDFKQDKKSQKSKGLVERARKYLTNHAKLDFGGMPAWCRLMNLQKVRNCIVHTNGFVDKCWDCDYLKYLAGKKCGISLDDDGRLLLSDDFCRQNLDDLEVFFRDVFERAGWKV
ncbi:MAG: hypothetical protein U1F81_23435 [Verrucomicrobiaceae bacterium]